MHLDTAFVAVWFKIRRNFTLEIDLACDGDCGAGASLAKDSRFVERIGRRNYDTEVALCCETTKQLAHPVDCIARTMPGKI